MMKLLPPLGDSHFGQMLAVDHPMVKRRRQVVDHDGSGSVSAQRQPSPVHAEVDRLAAHIDLLPTLADLCQLDMPRPVKFDGTSLKPLMDSLGSTDIRKICLQEPTLEDVFLSLAH